MFALPSRRPPPSLPPARRIYAIGDVHGRLDLLTDLYTRIAADDAGRDPANTDILLLGDLIDRGAESAGVIRFAMLTQPAFANLVALKGNHESACLRALAGEEGMMARWLSFGGWETLESFGLPPALLDSDDMEAVRLAALDAIPAAQRYWLASLPLMLRSGDYVFAHAGIRPGVPLQEQSEEDLLWIRGDFLDSREDFGVTVVHGHTITKRPVVRPNRIGLDTGGYATDRLTAIGLEGSRRWLMST